MTEEIRVFTPEDEKYIEPFLQIFKNRLNGIRQFYNHGEIEVALGDYTPEKILNDIALNREKIRYVGNFCNQRPTGFLIENDREDRGKNWLIKLNHINWLVAKESGKGIGTDLIKDCIHRSKKMDKDYVSLNVSKQNVDARRLYERLGFIYAPNQFLLNNGALVMGYRLR